MRRWGVVIAGCSHHHHARVRVHVGCNGLTQLRQHWAVGELTADVAVVGDVIYVCAV